MHIARLLLHLVHSLHPRQASQLQHHRHQASRLLQVSQQWQREGHNLMGNRWLGLHLYPWQATRMCQQVCHKPGLQGMWAYSSSSSYLDQQAKRCHLQGRPQITMVAQLLPQPMA
jgi:hypothetical protein